MALNRARREVHRGTHGENPRSGDGGRGRCERASTRTDDELTRPYAHRPRRSAAASGRTKRCRSVSSHSRGADPRTHKTTDKARALQAVARRGRWRTERERLWRSMRQTQLVIAGQTPDRRLAALGAGSIPPRFRPHQGHRSSPSRVLRAPGQLAVVLPQTALGVGRDPRVQAAVGAAQQVDVPQGLCRGGHRRTNPAASPAANENSARPSAAAARVCAPCAIGRPQNDWLHSWWGRCESCSEFSSSRDCGAWPG